MIFSFLSAAFGVTLSSSLNAAFSSLAKKECVVIINPSRCWDEEAVKTSCSYSTGIQSRIYLSYSKKKMHYCCLKQADAAGMSVKCLFHSNIKLSFFNFFNYFQKDCNFSYFSYLIIWGQEQDFPQYILHFKSCCHEVVTSCNLCVQSLLQ